MSQNPQRSISRRTFCETATFTASLLAGGRLLQASPWQDESAEAFDRPFLTPAEDFRTVARGNPKPHTLTGQALLDARLTPETWRLEITADPIVDPPHVRVPAAIDGPFTLAEETALDMPTLLKLGKQYEVKYIKAMQCLNIPTPLGQGLWQGVPLRDVLRLCGKMINVRRIYYWGFHNNDPKQMFRSSLSYTQVMESPPGELPVFLAYRLNGEPIPLKRGGPVRMIVPWAHGFKSVKWLQNIFVTNDYRSNDTYASMANNDPESHLKTAAYVDQGPEQISAGNDLTLTGLVINGLSGCRRVEYWIRKVSKPSSEQLVDDDPELLTGPWTACQLDPQPDWSAILPKSISTKDLLGFDRQSGQPLSWPLRYAVAPYRAQIRGLGPGHYEIRARSVDLNGFAQPEPRPQLRSGKNSIQVWRVQIV